MKTSVEGIELIKHFEGFREKAYQDVVGVWTIGYGHTGDVYSGQKKTPEQGEQLLQKDLLRFENWVNERIPVLKQNEFDALVALVFNVGSLSRESGLFKALKEKDYTQIVLRWNMYTKAGGRELLGLVRRRLSETCMFTGYNELKWRPASKLPLMECKKEVQEIVKWLS
jgi:lysozyme